MTYNSDDLSSPLKDGYPDDYTMQLHLAGGLYLVATPIGNLRDITLRALDTLRNVSVIACEDTRIIRRLLDHYHICRPLIVYHDHCAQRIQPRLMDRLEAGEAVALVSDAGTPLISDPGYTLVRECLARGIAISAVPGANAVVTALVLSGLPTDRFLFVGFLPAKGTERSTAVAALSRYHETLVIYESPRRLPMLLRELAVHIGERKAAVVREMTKLFEQVRRGSISQLAHEFRLSGPPKGEVVLVVAPPQEKKQELDLAMVDQELRMVLSRNTSMRDAVAAVAAISGWPRRDIYRRALALTDETRQMKKSQLSRLSHRRGRWGEFVGRWFLRLKGYRILERRCRFSGGEIDIIARRGEVLVMVEVKARSDRHSIGHAVTIHQQRRLVRTACAFLANNQHLASLVLRFDVVIVIGGLFVHHIQAAFDPKAYLGNL